MWYSIGIIIGFIVGFIDTISLLAFIVLIIMGIISAIRRKGSAKRYFAFAGAAFILLVVSIVASPITIHENTVKENITATYFKEMTSATTDGEIMEDITYNFIVENEKWFPAKSESDKSDVNKLIDTNITSRHLIKNIKPYLDKFVKISGNVVEIIEQNIDTIGTNGFVHITDEYGNSVTGAYIGGTDLLEGDAATIIGVPITTFSFSNVSNGIFMAISEITKTQ